jgi:hypothetical protein
MRNQSDSISIHDRTSWQKYRITVPHRHTFLTRCNPCAHQVYRVKTVKIILEVVGHIALNMPKFIPSVRMFYEKLLNLIHLPLEIIIFCCLNCGTCRQFFVLLIFLLMVLLDVGNLFDILLFAVLFEVFAMSCF